MKSSTIFIPLSSLLLSRAFAQTASCGKGAGPTQNVNITQFEDRNHHPNATGHVTLHGVDTSKTNADNLGAPKSWDVYLNVTDIMTSKDDTVTNSVISLKTPSNIFTPAPAAANNTQANSWDTCMIVIQKVSTNVTVKGQKDHGNCDDTFGNKCVESIQNALKDASNKAGNARKSGQNCGFQFPAIPKECQGMFTTDVFNQTITGDQHQENAWYYDSSDPYKTANLTAYETAETRIWPVILLQSTGMNFKNGKSATSSKMSCLRAKNIEKGSKKVHGVPGMGYRVQATAWGLAGVMVVMAWAL